MTRVKIRVDVMAEGDDQPLQSFVGRADAVRKAVIKWLDGVVWPITIERPISREHASYIGYEIARANMDEHYVQD